MSDSKYFVKAQDQDGRMSIRYSDTIIQENSDSTFYEIELSRDYFIISTQGEPYGTTRTIIKGNFVFSGYELISGTLLGGITVLPTGQFTAVSLLAPVNISFPAYDPFKSLRDVNNVVVASSMGEYSKFFPVGWSKRLFESDLVSTNAISGVSDPVQSSITYALGANEENLTLTGTAAINGTGNTLNNVLTGNGAANILNGGAGSDSMNGGGGNDTYVVDNSGDTVVEELNAGTDTVQSSITYTLGANVENLTLTGTAAINGTGNGLNNVLTGNGAANILTGGVGKDLLTGLGGADTIRYTALTDSLLTGFDRITDFAIGTDRLDGPTAVSAANTKELGTVATFNQAGISAVLTTAVFGANQAATFTFGSGLTARTFLSLNNGTAGFSSTTDSLIEITGYSGLLTNLSII